jgi:hypothetical protein
LAMRPSSLGDRCQMKPLVRHDPPLWGSTVRIPLAPVIRISIYLVGRPRRATHLLAPCPTAKQHRISGASVRSVRCRSPRAVVAVVE